MEENIRLPEHPDAREEYARLQETCDAIARETREVEALTGAKAGECMDVQMEEDPDEQEEVTLQRFRARLDRLRQLALAAGQAYFAGRGKAGNLVPGPVGRTGSENVRSDRGGLAFPGREPVLFRPDRADGL